MKRLVLLLAVCLAAASCKSKITPISTVYTNNPGQTAALLLEVDGCKVYRFRDGDRDVYFTTCKGQAGYDYTSRQGKSQGDPSC